ncbi:hypothetical protein D3C72_1132780 [compost metagenome]
MGKHGVVDGSRRRTRVLRIGRQDGDALAAFAFQLGQHFRQGRRTVAHGHGHRHAVMAALSQGAGQQLGLLLRMHFQRRTFTRPDRRVFLRRLARAERQDDQVQDEPPDDARNLHHARIRQELLQVTPHGRRGRRIGRAQVDQHHGAAVDAAMRVRRFCLK